MINEELLFKLIRTRHLNSEEREKLGYNKIPISEIIEVIRTILEKEKYFPVGVFPNISGEGIYEGAIIEKLDSKSSLFFGFFLNYKYRLHIQRAYAWDPFTVAESRYFNYRNLTSIVKKYISLEWGIKRDISGIKIDWHS